MDEYVIYSLDLQKSSGSSGLIIGDNVAKIFYFSAI